MDVAACWILKMVFRVAVEISACMYISLYVVTSHEVQHVIHNKTICSSQAAK